MQRKFVPILLVMLSGFGIYALHNFIVRSHIHDARIGNIISFGIYFLTGIVLAVIKRKTKILSDLSMYSFLLVGIFFDVQGLFQTLLLFPVITPISTLSKICGFYLGYKLWKRSRMFYSILFLFFPLFIWVTFILIPKIEYNKQNNDFAPAKKQVNYTLLRTQTGDTINSRSLTGKVVLLDFYFQSCKPCREKFPSLEKLKLAFKDRNDVEIIGVYCDVDHSIEELPAFLVKNKIKMTTLIDQDLKLCKELGIKSYPVEVIVNRKGEIVSTYWGFLLSASDKYVEERTKIINELLKTN